MNKTKKKKRFNQGNSFIVVVATVSFLAVLVTALLVAVALCYRMKAYDINARDNFYYLEQAMDEIYEGVGAITMQHLNEAYDETAEVLVYFDPSKESYVTMNDDDANKIMKQNFISKMKAEIYPTDPAVPGAFSAGQLKTTLESFITADNVGVQLADTVQATANDGTITISNIVLTREAEYSTVNTAKGDNQAAPATFIQSITTDLVITEPDFNISFTGVGDDVEDIYEFVMISDMGVEISGIGTQSHITGNIYAAADFYNKEYDTSVNSYTADQLAKCDGISEKSMYSGFYVSGAKVSVIADKMIVPGSIAAMNCSELSIVGDADNTGADYAQVWADGLVLGGYSRKLSAASASYTGSTLDMKADTYVYDDLEVNATGSKFTLDGTYYGYNYATTDNRKYSNEFIQASTNRKYLSGVKINDGNYIGDDGEGGHLYGQAHYNSSSVIVNGEDAVLDLSNTSSIFIAGQAYVELSKTVESKTFQASEENDKLTLNEVTDDVAATLADENKVTIDTYRYDEQSDDNYTTDNVDDADAYSGVQDYRTGEGLSVKSNQLAYIPPYQVQEDADGNLYVEWPALLTTTDYFKDIWADLSKVPVIKTEVSGNVYYFYDFSKANDGITMNEYMEKYAELFDPNGQARSTGTMADFYDITDYKAFQVENVILDGEAGTANVNDIANIESKLYSNSAISVKKDGKIKVIADSKATDVLTNASNALLQMNNNNTNADFNSVTIGIQQEYKEMKMLLTTTAGEADDVNLAHDTEESKITPINQYFDFAKLTDLNYEMSTGYRVFMSDDDITIAGAAKIKGIVVCKGDVTFGPEVEEFEGIIVAGGKIKVEQSINFVANAEVVKSVLRECYESNKTVLAQVCNVFVDFLNTYGNASGNNTNDDVVSMKSVTAVQYEDMLAFKNWKKNVD